MPAWETLNPIPGDVYRPLGTRWMPADLRRAYLQDQRRLHWTVRAAINEAVQRALNSAFAQPTGYYGVGLRELLGVDAAEPIIMQITGKD